MEFVILGLLSLRAMTVYDINKALEKSISLFYSASFGSINAAVAKMLNKNWITSEEKIENGRNKKILHPTLVGRQAFDEWLGSEIEQEKVKDPALTRLFFMGMLPIEERIPLLEKHLENLRQTLAALDIIHREATAKQAPAEMQDTFNYQMLTLQYGLDFYTFNVDWYENLLLTLKKELPNKLASR